MLVELRDGLNNWLTVRQITSKSLSTSGLVSSTGRSVGLFCVSQSVCLVDEKETIYGLKSNSNDGEKNWEESWRTATATTNASGRELMRCNGDGWWDEEAAEWSIHASLDWLNVPLQLTSPHHHRSYSLSSPLQLRIYDVISTSEIVAGPVDNADQSTACRRRTLRVSHRSDKSCKMEWWSA